MILSIPEYDSYPALPEQWDRFYHTTLDKIFIQVLPTTDPSYPDWEEMAGGAELREDQRRSLTLVRSQYAARDYQTFLDETMAYISEQWGASFNNFLNSEPAIMFAEYISAALDELSWNLDREVDEWYLELSKVKSNVARLARYLGYKPAPAVSASATVTVTLTNGPYAFDVTLRAGHQFQGPNDLVFELTSDQTIPAGDTTKDMGVYQGKTYIESFLSNGSAKQVFNLSLIPNGQYLALGKTRCWVGIDEWTEEDFLPYGNDSVFEVNELHAPPQIRFGDGVIGRIPPSGNEIKVQYVATSGKTSSLAIEGTISKSLTTVVVNYQIIPLSVTNEESASGGADSEAIESIKANAPRYFIAADRLVTQQDYETLAGHYAGIAGSVAMANATMIRGVESDLQLQELMDELTADRSALDGYLEQIKTDQTTIKGKTGTTTTADSIRYLSYQVSKNHVTIKEETANIDTQVGVTQSDITDLTDFVSDVYTMMDSLPYQEAIGYGDGTTRTFTKVLGKTPIQENTLAVLVANKSPSKSGTDGDCDASPGRISSSTITFTSADVGLLIRIGGDMRQISKLISSSTVEYTGPRIYGTSLIFDVYPAAVVGYDVGGGVIAGTGIDSGSVSYDTGSVTVQLSVAPAGLTGMYGVPVICSYGWKYEAAKSVLDNVTTEAGAVSSDVDVFSTIKTGIDTTVDEADVNLGSIETACVAIDAAADDATAQANLALVIPDQIQTDIDAVYEYLDTVISGQCKANIVRVSCLVLDANGFYTAPSLALIEDLKTYLDARKIATVVNSVVSGAYYLVKVKLVVEIKVSAPYTFQVVSASVSSALDTMFKGRKYEQPLLRSEYYKAVNDVTGVEYANIKIPAQTGETYSPGIAYADADNDGTPPAVDSNGNLFVADYEVVTKWEVYISQIVE